MTAAKQPTPPAPPTRAELVMLLRTGALDLTDYAEGYALLSDEYVRLTQLVRQYDAASVALAAVDDAALVEQTASALMPTAWPHMTPAEQDKEQWRVARALRAAGVIA